MISKATLKVLSKKHNIPVEWINLYLAVADCVDGLGLDRCDCEECEGVEQVYDTFNTIFETKLGKRIYSDAIDMNKGY